MKLLHSARNFVTPGNSIIGLGKREFKHLPGSGARDFGFSAHSKQLELQLGLIVIFCRLSAGVREGAVIACDVDILRKSAMDACGENSAGR